MSTERRPRGVARLLGAALGALLATASAPAQAEGQAAVNVPARAPSYLPMDSAANLQARFVQLSAYVDSLAGAPAPFALRDRDAYCAEFAVFDMLRKTDELWPSVARLPRKTLVASMANMIRACGYSEGATRRSGYLLDYLYWNRLADTTGYEVADALVVRDVFYELFFNRRAARLLTSAEQATDTHPPDIFDAPPMTRVRPFHAVGSFPLVVTPAALRAFDQLVKTVDFREGHLLPFRGPLMNVLTNDQDLALVFSVYDYLLSLRASPQQLAERHGGWHALLRLADGDQARIFRVLGVLSSLLYLPIDELGPALAARKILTPARLRALHAGGMAYYMINELDERAGRVLPNAPHEVTFDFFYPDGYSSTNWKWYHYFNNAYLGCELTRQGYAAINVRAAAKTLAGIYEGITIHLAIPSRKTIGLDPRVNPVLEAMDDITINEDGAVFGAEACN
ncbi:MAG TPA: hypothetical protein VLT33_28045 [Labilithrix sp.]|nr:hypothetical protein [Labilithrix sp.]